MGPPMNYSHGPTILELIPINTPMGHAGSAKCPCVGLAGLDGTTTVTWRAVGSLGVQGSRWKFHDHSYDWLVVSNIFYFSIYLEESSQLTNAFQRG